MEYYILDTEHVPVKVNFEDFKKYWDKIHCEINITNNMIAFLIPHTIDDDGFLKTEYFCGAFIIINWFLIIYMLCLYWPLW